MRRILVSSKQVVQGTNTIIFDNFVPAKTYLIEFRSPNMSDLSFISYAINNIDIGGADFDIVNERVLPTLINFEVERGMIIGTYYGEFYTYPRSFTIRVNVVKSNTGSTNLDLYAIVIEEAKNLPYLILTKRETFSISGSNPTLQLKGLLNRKLIFNGNIKSFIVRNSEKNLWFDTGNSNVILDYSENVLDRVSELQLLVNNDTASSITITSRIPYIPPAEPIQPIQPIQPMQPINPDIPMYTE